MGARTSGDRPASAPSACPYSCTLVSRFQVRSTVVPVEPSAPIGVYSHLTFPQAKLTCSMGRTSPPSAAPPIEMDLTSTLVKV